MKERRRWKKPSMLLAVMVFFFGIILSPIVYTTTQLEAVTEFDSTKNLSTNSGASVDPAISASENNVYVVWIEKDSSGKSDVHFRASHDSGFSFGDIGNVSNSGTAAEAQVVAVAGNNVYVVWSDAKSGKSDIYISSSSDGGESFASTINLSNNAGISDQPRIASTDDGRIYIVWQDSISGSTEILLKAGGNGGNEFGSVKNLSNNDGSSGNPEIAASERSVYVTWIDNTPGNAEVFFAASTNGASSFGTATNLSNTPGASYRAQIAASGDKVYITWRDTPREVYIRTSESAGHTFSESINLSNDEPDSGWPEISATGDNVYLTWRAGPLEGLSKEVYIRTSENSGDFFDEVINLRAYPNNILR